MAEASVFTRQSISCSLNFGAKSLITGQLVPWVCYESCLIFFFCSSIAHWPTNLIWPACVSPTGDRFGYAKTTKPAATPPLSQHRWWAIWCSYICYLIQYNWYNMRDNNTFLGCPKQLSFTYSWFLIIIGCLWIFKPISFKTIGINLHIPHIVSIVLNKVSNMWASNGPPPMLTKRRNRGRLRGARISKLVTCDSKVRYLPKLPIKVACTRLLHVISPTVLITTRRLRARSPMHLWAVRLWNEDFGLGTVTRAVDA